MIKVLIMSKNNMTAKIIFNNVISKTPNLHLVGIANTLSEGLYFIENKEPNLIVTTSQHFIEYLNSYNHFYSPGIILISNQSNKSHIKYKQQKLLLCINADENYRMIVSKTLNFISKNFLTPKKEFLKNFLETLGFDFKLSGTLFLLDALTYIITYKGAEYFENLSTDIYPFIARKYNTTSNIIKWSIERSVKYLYQKNTQKTYDIMEEYFGIKPQKRITPKKLITSIINLIQD